MGIWKRFVPEKMARSAYSIDYSKQYEKGIRGIIFDIDNTLVPQNAPGDDTVREFFKELHELGFRTCLISNNSEERVKPFAEIAESLYVADAGKPLLRSYTQAMALLHTDINETLFVGDQILTDIFGAKRLGMPHILVKPLDPKHEYLRIKLKRIIEKPIIAEYRHQNKLTLENDDDLL